jgi:hypothetical protein
MYCHSEKQSRKVRRLHVLHEDGPFGQKHVVITPIY